MYKMYGNIVSSNGLKQMETAQNEVILTMEKPISYLSLHIDHETMVYLNDDPDGIHLPKFYSQPFVIDKISVWKVRIVRYGDITKFGTNGQPPVVNYSYYGLY
jgi:hypothetical protein